MFYLLIWTPIIIGISHNFLLPIILSLKTRCPKEYFSKLRLLTRGKTNTWLLEMIQVLFVAHLIYLNNYIIKKLRGRFLYHSDLKYLFIDGGLKCSIFTFILSLYLLIETCIFCYTYEGGFWTSNFFHLLNNILESCNISLIDLTNKNLGLFSILEKSSVIFNYSVG